MICEVCGCKLEEAEEDEGICRNCQCILSLTIDNEIENLEAN